MTMHKALHPRDDTNRFYLCQEKEEEDLPEFKIVLMHRYWKTIYMNVEED